MPRRVFVAGATGVIGRPLVSLLVAAGFAVSGTTRRAERAAGLRAAGAEPVIVDAFDATALAAAVAAARPEVVIHQLTDLPQKLDPALMPDAIGRNARLRIEGTRNLVAAALAAGARRLIAQSIAFAYAPGGEPHDEDDPLDLGAAGARAVTVEGVAALERMVLGMPGLEGVVLRYGRLYGPGTGSDTPRPPPFVRVDAAAEAADLAMDRGGGSIYNIAEPGPEVSSEKAGRELGWRADFRRPP